MTKKEKLEFRKQLYTKFQNKIDDCLNDLDNHRKLKELLYIFKGYFDASLLEVAKDQNVKQVVQVQITPQDNLDKNQIITSEDDTIQIQNEGGEDNE